MSARPRIATADPRAGSLRWSVKPFARLEVDDSNSCQQLITSQAVIRHPKGPLAYYFTTSYRHGGARHSTAPRHTRTGIDVTWRATDINSLAHTVQCIYPSVDSKSRGNRLNPLNHYLARACHRPSHARLVSYHPYLDAKAVHTLYEQERPLICAFFTCPSSAVYVYMPIGRMPAPTLT